MDVTPQAAASAITASRVESSLSLGRTPIGVARSSPEICWAISGIPMAAFNFVIRLRRGPDTDRQIDAMQQAFVDHDAYDLERLEGERRAEARRTGQA